MSLSGSAWVAFLHRTTCHCGVSANCQCGCVCESEVLGVFRDRERAEACKRRFLQEVGPTRLEAMLADDEFWDCEVRVFQVSMDDDHWRTTREQKRLEREERDATRAHEAREAYMASDEFKHDCTRQTEVDAEREERAFLERADMARTGEALGVVVRTTDDLLVAEDALLLLRREEDPFWTHKARAVTRRLAHALRSSNLSPAVRTRVAALISPLPKG